MRVVLAVSGTLQEGFPLRKNLDAPGAPAVHLGSGLVRCVKSYLDTKEPGCREHGNDPNPCCVVTGDEADANVYELYLVDGEACVAALLGEPRYLAMAPDAVALDLEAAETSGVVKAFARECLGDVARCSVLAVVSAVRAPPSFVATPTAGGPTDFASGVALARDRGLLRAPADDAAKRRARATLGGAAPRLSGALPEARAAALLRKVGLDAAPLVDAAAPPPRDAAACLRALAPAAAAACLVPFVARGRGRTLAAFAAGVLAAAAARRLEATLEARAMERRATAAAAPGAELGDVAVPCGGGRRFHVSRRDTAVVCIDLQVDFLDADRGRVAKHYDERTLAHAHAARDNAARLLAAARRGGLTVAHSRSHRYGARIRRDLVGRGDAGYALDAAVAARPGEIVVDKWTFGAFASTDLEARLRRRGVTRILLCGVLTNVCVMATAVQACDRLFRVCLVEDATGAFDAGWHESAVGLINGPQVAAGHARAPAATGLYFGEKTTVANVEAALEGL